MSFVCKVCGYVYEGPEAPEECPLCHKKDVFIEQGTTAMKKNKYEGGGMFSFKRQKNFTLIKPLVTAAQENCFSKIKTLLKPYHVGLEKMLFILDEI